MDKAADKVSEAGTHAVTEPAARERVCGTCLVRGRIRSRMEDFRVDEDLGFEPSGKGEHVLLQVEKTGCNTFDVARMLARHSGTQARHVGYSGLKDKNADARNGSVCRSHPALTGRC